MLRRVRQQISDSACELTDDKRGDSNANQQSSHDDMDDMDVDQVVEEAVQHDYYSFRNPRPNTVADPSSYREVKTKRGAERPYSLSTEHLVDDIPAEGEMDYAYAVSPFGKTKSEDPRYVDGMAAAMMRGGQGGKLNSKGHVRVMAGKDEKSSANNDVPQREGAASMRDHYYTYIENTGMPPFLADSATFPRVPDGTRGLEPDGGPEESDRSEPTSPLHHHYHSTSAHVFHTLMNPTTSATVHYLNDSVINPKLRVNAKSK